MLKQKDQSKLGQMKVHIQVKDKDGRSLFDQEKTLTAREHETKISLGNFKAIKTGEYDFLINAQDLFTGKEANLHQKIKVKH